MSNYEALPAGPTSTNSVPPTKSYRTGFSLRDRRIVAIALASLVSLLVWVLGISSALSNLGTVLVSHRVGNSRKRFESRLEAAESLYGLGSFGGRSWLDHLAGLNEEGLAPATMFAQEWVYRSQNPPLEDCKTSQFYLFDTTDTWEEGHGLGSAIHVASYALFRALESGRILMWHDESTFGSAFIEDGCLVDGIKSLDCIYEPLSHCPRSSMTEGNTVRGGKLDPPPGWPQIWTGAIPTKLQNEINRILPYPMSVQAQKFWWRGQAAAYFLRLNRASLEYIARTRLTPDAHEAFSVNTSTSPPSLIPHSFPFPLPRSVTSMHIRHGDKGTEMELEPLTAYVEKGEDLARLNPHGYAKMAFLSSEDPEVFEEAATIRTLDEDDTTSNLDWIWFISKINRMNAGPFAQIHEFGNRTETTLSWMAELLLALECDAWVGTLGSNWSRLLAELRCIWVDRCQNPYLEVGPRKDWGGYNW